MKKISAFLFLVSILVLPFSRGYVANEIGEELKLYLGESRILSVNSPSRVVIGNPAVADVANVTTTEVTIAPKSQGTTTLIIWDNMGEQSYKVKVFSENIDDVKKRVDSLLEKLDMPHVYSQAAEDEGKVLLLGYVKTPQERERINTALGTLRDRITDLMLVKEEESVIDIDVQVLELNKDASTALGFSNFLNTESGYTVTEVGSPGISDVGTKFSTLFKVLNLKRTAFNWTLYAMVKEGSAKILSRPRLSCQSGKEAELLVGGEKPIFATIMTETSTGATVEYKEYGIKLKIKPTVTEEGRIKLALNVDVSDIESAESFGTLARAYPLKKRTASTELYINDGQTLAIGGLIRQKDEEDTLKTPGLGDIPILGVFFRKKATKTGGGGGERGNTELFITLTPTILKTKVDETLAKAKEQEEEAKPALSSPSQPEPQPGFPAPVVIPANKAKPNIPQLSDVERYTRIVQRKILDNLEYPKTAKDAGFQGVVRLNLHLDYTGQLLDIKVAASSGYKVLDDNAASVAKLVKPYPPFPTSIENKDIWLEVPVVYRLD